MDETWKDYDTNYRVSNTGRVWSVRNSIELSKFEDGYGYHMVTLYGRTLKVHRLVAKLFIECTDPSRDTVNHKNGIKTDNSVDNLEWLSCSDNNKHAGATGLMCAGADVHTAVLNVDSVTAIKKLFVEYKLGDTEIGALFGVNNSTVSNIRRGIAWKTVAPELKFDRVSPQGRAMSKKLTGEDIPKIRAMRTAGLSCPEIGRKFNVASATIQGILLGKTWKNY